MRKYGWIALGLLLALAFSMIWYAVKSLDRGGRGTGNGPEAVAEFAPEGPTDGEDLSFPDQSQRAIQRLEAWEEQVADAPLEGVELQVIKGFGPSSEPAADVLVGYLAEEQLPEIERLTESLRGYDWFDRVGKYGQFFRADETGRVILPRPRRSAYVMSFDGFLSGSLTFSLSEVGRNLSLHLSVDRQIEVQVVGAGAEPLAGADVGLFSNRTGQLLHMQETNLQGRVAFEHIGQFRQLVDPDYDPLSSPDSARDLRVAVLGPWKEGRSEFANWNGTLPGKPVQLKVAEPRGTLSLRIIDAQGRTWKRPALVTLAGRGGGLAHAIRRTTRIASEGVVAFTHVPSGPRLMVTVNSINEHQPASMVIEPGLEDRELREITLTLGTQLPVFVGRAIGLDGSPMANTAVDARIYRESSRRSRMEHSALTNDEGVFRVPMDVAWESAINLVAEFTTLNEYGVLLGSLKPLGGPFAKRVQDIGDVVFSRPPVLVEGTVMSSSGQPIANASVYPNTEITETAAGRQSFDVCTSDDEGRFTIVGYTAEANMNLAVTHADYATPKPESVATGSSGVTLIMEASGVVRGQFMFDAGVNVERCPVELQRLSPAGDPVVVNLTIEGRQGDYASGLLERRGLPGGVYGLRVLLQGAGAQNMELPALTILAGEVTQLGTVDLRGQVRQIQVGVRDELGQPVRSGLVRWRESGSGAAWLGDAPIRNGMASFACPTKTMELEVQSEGFSPWSQRNVNGNLQVTLRSGLRASFDSDDLFGLPPGWAVSVQLLTERNLEPVARFVVAAGGTEVQFDKAGRYAVQFFVVDRDSGRRGGPVGTSQWVQLRDQGGIQQFRLGIPVDALEQALQRTSR